VGRRSATETTAASTHEPTTPRGPIRGQSTRPGRETVVVALLGGHLKSWIDNYGYEAVFVLVGLESIGIPIPGETALITAALYAATTHRLEIGIVIAAATAGAIIGDNIGFTLGRWGGYALLRRYGKYIRVDERRLKIGRYIFQEQGGKVVFIGRFIAVLRTYAAFLAGTNRMQWRRFLVFNAAGGITWACAVGLAYYYIGSAVKNVRGPLDIVLGAVAVLVVVGFLLYLRKAEERYAALAEQAFPSDLEDP
jgi:membrane protein DedA with SNARE-associated domain